MIKKLATMALCVILSAPLFSHEASASNLTKAFDSLLVPGAAVAATAPGRYQSGARNSFVAGGLEMRFPRNDASPKMFSFSPPRISAGCNGVSAHFGGFSFISGKEFEQLVRGIASGAALGFVTMISIKGLCPVCADVIQQLKNAAQLASRLAIDSCRLGQEIFKKFSGEQTDFTTTLCGSTTSDSGGSNDFLAAISKTCNNVAGALDGLSAVNNIDESTPEGKAKKSELMCKAGVGNVTWATLGGNSLNHGANDTEVYARKIILMNMMGATLRHDGATASCQTATGLKETDEHSRATVYCPPLVNAKDITGLFMCGSNPRAVANTRNQTIIRYCQQYFSNVSTTGGTASHSGVNGAQFMVCEDSDKVNCSKLKLVPAQDITVLGGMGFLPQVSSLLQKGVTAVRSNTEMPADVITLMETVPYPLYQAINAAAVYPVAASDLLDSISILVAEAASGSMLNEFLRWHGREGSHSCTSEEQVQRILATLEASRASNDAMKTLISQNMVAQNAVKEQIRMLNIAIQQQVMTTDLLQQNQMAQSIARAVVTGAESKQKARENAAKAQGGN